MTEPATIAADYTLRPSEFASTLSLLVEARQPCIVWGPPGCAKSQIAQQVATDAGRAYVDVRALLLDPVDLRGIPWRDSAARVPAALGRPRPLAHQPRRVPVRRPDGPGWDCPRPLRGRTVRVQIGSGVREEGVRLASREADGLAGREYSVPGDGVHGNSVR